MKNSSITQWIAVVTSALVLAACAPKSPDPDTQQVGFSDENAKMVADAWEDCEISESEQVEILDVLESDWGDFEWNMLPLFYADIILYRDIEEIWEEDQITFMVTKCRDDHDGFLELIEEAKLLGDFFFEHSKSPKQLPRETEQSMEERVKRFEIAMFGSEMVF